VAEVGGAVRRRRQRRRDPAPVYWQFVPSWIKATDNRVRFGCKERWPQQ